MLNNHYKKADIEKEQQNLIFNDLNLEIDCNEKSKINEQFFLTNYGDTKTLTNIVFTYNNNDEETIGSEVIKKTNYRFKFQGPAAFLKASILIVGGGGGGGYNIGGGGGGGEVIYIDNLLLQNNINYDIIVGGGGAEGDDKHYSGESGYNSSINSIIATGGGGGGSYIYAKPSDIMKIKKKDDIIFNKNCKGLDGGCGGGSSGLQYNIEDEIKHKGNYVFSDNPLSNKYGYNRFGNNGGISITLDENTEQNKIRFNGGGGGGAGSKGDDNNDGGNGGNGIVIENIDIKKGVEKYCPIFYDLNGPKLKCENIDIIINDNTYKKTRTTVNNIYDNHIYWGAGGGAGTFNAAPGDGGLGGGGGGGYYEDYLSAPMEVWNGTGGLNFFNISNLIAGWTTPSEQITSNGLKSSSLTQTAKGGNGIIHTGSGGGGGGLNSNGGIGGSGIVILLIENNKYEIESDEVEKKLSKLPMLLNNLEINKKILGKNLSYLFNFYIKENKEFYDFIDKIYEDKLINKDILPYSYDREIYDIKLNQYIKILFDLKINYDSYLFFVKKVDEIKYIDNHKLYDYQRIIILLIDILEDLIIFSRDNKNFYKLLKNIDKIQISFLNKNRDNFNIIDSNDKINKEIEFIQKLVKNKESRLERDEILFKQGKIDRESINKTKTDKEKLLTKEAELKESLKQKNDKDLYFRYEEQVHGNEISKVLILFISTNNSFNITNDVTSETEEIININNLYTSELTDEDDKRIYFDINKMRGSKTINEFIETNIKNFNINSFIQMYLYTLLIVKEYNFNKNLYSLYIFFNYVNLIQNLYKTSEKILLGKEFLERDDYLNLCRDNDIGLYKLLNYTDNIINKFESLTGNSFINQYIDNYKIKKATIVANSCPIVTIKLDDNDTTNIIQLFRQSQKISDENIEELKEEKYYNNLIESFIIEFDNNRFDINNIQFDYGTDNESKSYIKDINIIININNFDICKNLKTNDNIEDILIISKDFTHIKNQYDNDVNKIQKYDDNINKYKKELENLDEKYNEFKNQHNSLTNKSYIFYIIIGILTLIVISLYLFNIKYEIKSVLLFIILSILIILLIYNYYTGIQFDIIDKFTDLKTDLYNVEYYKIKIAEVTNYKNDNENEIIIKLNEIDQDKLKIRKFKKNNNPSNIKDLLKNNLLLYYNNLFYEIQDIELEIENNYYYYIINITFNIQKENALDIDTDIKNVIILKNDESIIKKLLNSHDQYITYSNNYDTCEYMYNNNPSDIKINELYKIARLEYVYTIRNDILRYINNKFIIINKIFDSIELENANNIYNNVQNALDNEKNNHNLYEREFIHKKNYNKNVNNLYKHQIIYQNNFINMLLILYFIIVMMLLLLNMFPNNIIIILIIGTILIIFNMFLYAIKILHSSRKDSNFKYWGKPDKYLL